MTDTTRESAPVDFDGEWERRAKGKLDETEFDTELGLDLARDAQKVVAGELSEARFREKYHDAVREEFGEDDRELPDPDDGSRGLEERLRGTFDDEESRRSFVKKGGVAAMGLSMLLGGDDDPGDGVAAAADDD